MRMVVLGGGFGGVATVRHLERVLRRRTDVEITLVSRENFFVLTPLLPAVLDNATGRLLRENAMSARRGPLDPAGPLPAPSPRGRVERVAEGDGYSAARLLRLGRLLNAIAAALAVRGTEPGEKRVARTECGCTKQQSHRDRDRPGEPDRIRSHFDRHTGEQQSCPYRHGNRDALMRYPRECSGNHADQQPPEDTAPNARATQIS